MTSPGDSPMSKKKKSSAPREELDDLSALDLEVERLAIAGKQRLEIMAELPYSRHAVNTSYVKLQKLGRI